MSFSEVTNQNWFSRMGGALKGIVFGGILVLISFPLLFWNEGRAVHRAKTLAEGRGLVIADVSIDSVDPANEGKLVHMTGTASTSETLSDDKFFVSAENALKFRRTVEMYQWDEETETRTRKKLGGGKETVKEYTYVQRWSESEIDSDSFDSRGQSDYGSGNPPMPFQSTSKFASSVDFGAYQLSDNQVQQIHRYQPIELSESDLSKIEDEALRAKMQVSNNEFYVGADPGSPKIGDLRVSFEYTGPSEISFVYQQAGSTFQPYKLPKGDIQLFTMGKVGASEMFTQAETANKVLTWVLRLVGFLLMSFGFGLCLRPLAVMGDVVPFIGSLVGAGIALISAVIAGGLTLITIAIAWLFYRPLLAAVLIAMAIGLFVLARKLMKKPASTQALPADDGIPVVG